MASIAMKRVTKELAKLEKSGMPDGIEIFPDKIDILSWIAHVKGGDDTPHEGLVYKLQVKIPESYPTKPPSVTFLSTCFHPNVYRDGKLCLDILQGMWSPVLRVESVLVSIQSLLDDPNPSSPANSDAARAYKADMRAYKKAVQTKYKF